MSTPAYHLRLNKSIDRFILVDAIRHLRGLYDLHDYTYYGLGGPLLQDCRLIYEYHPEVKIVSLEEDTETFKRQEFHRFASEVTLLNESLSDFLASFSNQGKAIFWLDYTDLKLSRLHEFAQVLTKVPEGSIVRITLRARFSRRRYESFADARERFEGEFDPLIHRPVDDAVYSREHIFIEFVEKMVRIQSERALPAEADGNVFQVLNSSSYSDGTDMLSVTGIVCPLSDQARIREYFSTWKLADLDWSGPCRIDVPVLSTKERLRLEGFLPLAGEDCVGLRDALNYRIDSIDEQSWSVSLKQYADFHRYYPFFARVSV